MTRICAGHALWLLYVLVLAGALVQPFGGTQPPGRMVRARCKGLGGCRSLNKLSRALRSLSLPFLLWIRTLAAARSPK